MSRIYDEDGAAYAAANPLPVQLSDGSAAITTLAVDSELPAAGAGADGATNPTAPFVLSAKTHFNGTTWDRERGNTNVTLLTSAARTTTQNGADTTNYNHRGLHVILDMTESASSPSVTLTVQGKDEISGKYYTILAGAAVTTTTTNIYKVYPGITAAANASASDILPRSFRIIVTANNANTGTYSVGYSLVV